MLTFTRGWLCRLLIFGLILTFMTAFCSITARADDCKRVSNILVLFDASGFMKEKSRWEFFLQQMAFFQQAMPVTADGFFNVGIRHYGLKVGLGCENTESILAIQPWDPEKFLNAFPRTVSYGVSSLSAGLRASGDEVASAEGKTIIVLIGGGLESCNMEPVKVTDQICRNNPDLEIHTFQIGNAPEGSFLFKGDRRKKSRNLQPSGGFQILSVLVLVDEEESGHSLWAVRCPRFGSGSPSHWTRNFRFQRFFRPLE